MGELYADIIIPLSMDGIFTYAVPDELSGVLTVGDLATIPFASNKQYTGLVLRIHNNRPEGDFTIRTIAGQGDPSLHFSETHLKFLHWIWDYYMTYPGDVLRAALPVFFRLESVSCVALEQIPDESTTLSAAEKRILAFLEPNRYVSISDLEKSLQIKNLSTIVKPLINQGFVVIKETIDELFKPKTETMVRWARPFSEEELNAHLDQLKRCQAQYKMLCRWIERQEDECTKTEFVQHIGDSTSALSSLCQKGILACYKKEVSRIGNMKQTESQSIILSKIQTDAFESIKQQFTDKQCVLLHGVTSSGKTEVYIKLIQEYLAQGKQVLYMLPEISITVQIIKRLQRIFGSTFGIYHSGMPDNVRAELWKKQCSDTPYPFILGVRSSIFLPFSNLGLIIVDEEHDPSYKQREPSPRYNARDAALMLGTMHHAKTIVGSATPSFESFENAQSGKYGYVAMNQRYGNILLPDIQLVDTKEYRRKKRMASASFSPDLHREIQQVLGVGKQAILFQNRRGYSTYLQCSECGEIVRCKHCDVSMTYYKERHEMVCRYCGSLRPAVERCDKCGGTLRLRTPGTERIEEECAQLFPDARIARIDTDVMGNKAKFRTLIDDFEAGKIQILIGTQMVAKGLDFDNVMLVGVLDADSMLSIADFRAEERAYSLLMQVSGRSGRRSERGKVLIQTEQIDNPLFGYLQKPFNAFFDSQIDFRRMFAYPPFCRLFRIELRHAQNTTVRQASNALAQTLRKDLGTRVCGPAVPEIGRIASLYRIHLLLKIERNIPLSKIRNIVQKAIKALSEQSAYKSIRIICDVDPY